MSAAVRLARRFGRGDAPGAIPRATSWRGSARGQSLLEFALVLPVFLVMIFAIVDMARVVWAYDNLGNAAREGARYASVHGGWEGTACPTGPNLPGSPASGCPTWTPDSKEPTRIATRSFLVAPGSNVTVYVCYYTANPCTNNTDGATGTNGRGEFVTVKVTSRVNLITPALLGFTGFDVSGTSTVIINN